MKHTNIKKLKGMFGQFRTILNDRQMILENRAQLPLFGPGLFVILLGMMVLLVPKLFIFLIATFFVVVGAFLCFLAWKVIQLKKKWENIRREFQGKFVVQGVQLHGIQVEGLEKPEVVSADAVDSKKIIFH
jgi:hypothetical protein